MISGFVSPKSIGLMNGEDINQLLKKSKFMFKVSRMLTLGMNFAAFFTPGIPLIINFSFPLNLIAIFWSIIYTICGHFCANINLSQMTYFYVICLYLKLKLRNVNNSIRKSFDKIIKFT